VVEKFKNGRPRLKLTWADGAYPGELIEWVKHECDWVLEVVKRNDDVKDFGLLPNRRVVERTFAWLGRFRGLSRDYAFSLETSASTHGLR